MRTTAYIGEGGEGLFLRTLNTFVKFSFSRLISMSFAMLFFANSMAESTVLHSAFKISLLE